MAERMRTSKIDAIIAELESLERIDGESETFKRNAIAYLQLFADCLDDRNIKSIKNVNLKENWELLLKEISTKKYQLIVLDEIQEINEWTNFLQAAIDLNKNAKFIVSGSSATALKQEIMVGRVKIFFINPLLFDEYKDIWNDNNIVYLRLLLL